VSLSPTLDRILLEDHERSNVGVWSQEHPPCDSGAEAAVLNMLLVYPDQMGVLDLRDRLYLPEHQTVRRAMSRVWLRYGLMECGPWTVAIFRELHDMLNGRHRGACTSACLAGLHWDVLCHGQTATLRDLAKWLARLDRCVEARRLIAAAQEQAARAWRGDVAGAAVVARQIASRAREVVRVDVE
jgi:hypothetical protein